ncbi:DEAD/DEAH box helicase family protein [Streptomyces sp. NPDC048441]|uniref:DEAD/DEAH box helicase family protein n=1 Tax=Streptomyces sp. NPDC048441 TaxID=3365552 RepID=UPI00371AC3ED
MPHQVMGCEAVVRALEAPVGGGEGGLRAQVRMACGTGKTRLAVEVANRVAAGGRVLVVGPTLELVKQNLVAFCRDGGRRGAMAAVCSLGPGDEVLASYGVSATTSSAQLAWWWRQLELQGHRAWTVFTTYASIPAIAEAHSLDVPGIPALPAWDLVVSDEAHRSAGTTTWSLVNDQDAVPAVRRLALTATPRIWSILPHHGDGGTSVEESARPGAEGDREARQEAGGGREVAELGGYELGVRVPVVGGEQPLASMDNPAWFGPVAYELTLQQAQAAGLVARFQIVVAEIDDPVLQEAVALEGRAGERVRGLYLAAQQTALLKAAREYGLERVLAYANRVEDAEAFAVTLAEQAGRLGAAGVAVPRRVWGASLSAKSTYGERRIALRERLVSGRGGDGREVDLSVVASVRLLGEGVDVPAVDAVAFIDPRQGAVDLVQCVGRALRIPAEQREAAQQSSWGRGSEVVGVAEKVATIVVPVVHLEAGSRGDLYGPAWDGVVALLRALRAHSEAVIDQLATPRTVHQAQSAGGWEGAGEGGGKGVVGVLRFVLAERDPSEVARWVRLRVREGLDGDVSRALAAARRFRERTGHLKVPRGHREGDVLLGVQIESWRKAYRAGELGGRLAGQLEEWGIEWAPRSEGWQAVWRAIGAYAAGHRHLLPRREETILVGGVVHDIGRIMTDCRRPAFARRWPVRVAGLDELRVNGRPVPWRVMGLWDVAWQRRLELIDMYLEEGGTIGELLAGSRRYGGEDLGQWVGGQLGRWAVLRPEQHQALRQRGIGTVPGGARRGTVEAGGTESTLVDGVSEPGVISGAGWVGEAQAGGPVVRRYSRAERFQFLVTAARQHVREVGPLVDGEGRHVVNPVWSTVIDGVEIRLRQRLHTARQRRRGLTDGQLGQLAVLGLVWAGDELEGRRAGSEREC